MKRDGVPNRLMIWSGFPGEIAGASLKRHILVRDDRRSPGGFPGEIAGASLKPGA